MVVTPPVMNVAQMPGPLASTVPSIGGECTITIETTKILPGMFGTRLKHTWSAGASTDWARNGKGVKEGNGILNIDVISALMGPGVMAVVEGVPGDRRGEDIVNDKMFMPYVKMSCDSEGSWH